jgi:hypothetical protein
MFSTLPFNSGSIPALIVVVLPMISLHLTYKNVAQMGCIVNNGIDRSQASERFVSHAVNDHLNGATHDRRNGAISKRPKSPSRTGFRL